MEKEQGERDEEEARPDNRMLGFLCTTGFLCNAHAHQGRVPNKDFWTGLGDHPY